MTFALVITLVAIVGQVGGSALGIRLTGRSKGDATVIRCGMNGSGAVELVVAGVVIQLSDDLPAGGIITVLLCCYLMAIPNPLKWKKTSGFLG